MRMKKTRMLEWLPYRNLVAVNIYLAVSKELPFTFKHCDAAAGKVFRVDSIKPANVGVA